MTKWSSKHVEQCRVASQLSFVDKEADLVDYQSDFGQMITSELPKAVAKPETLQQLSALMRYANRYQLPITLRSLGLSQSGQSLTSNGSLIVDMQAFNQIKSMQENRITAGCAVTWRDLIAHSLSANKLPYVFPYNMSLNLGGLLSSGGLGAATSKYGIAANYVEAMTVMKADGQLLCCDAGDDLFHAVLCGMGQFGIICDVSLSLRPCKPWVKSYYLLYSDYSQWLNDQLNLRGKVDYIEAYTLPLMLGLKKSDQGRIPLTDWMFCTHIAIEGEQDSWDDKVLLDLNFFKVSHQEVNTVFDYALRHDNRFKAMKMSGQWQLQHPWYECYVPASVLRENLHEILATVSLGLGGMYHIFPVEKCKPKYFMLPEEAPVFAFNILTPGVMPHQSQDCQESIRWLNRLFLNQGGKRYVSGWLGKGVGDEFWQSHYSEAYQEKKEMKARFDPNGIFCSSLHPR